MATAKKAELVEIRPLAITEVSVKIQGDSPLIVHAWSAKAKREILEKEIGATKTKAREAKNPLENFCTSLYWLTEMPTEYTTDSVTEALEGARFGFPLTGFKQAAISAAYRQGWTKDKMSLRGAFFIKPGADGYYGGDLEINFERKKVEIIPNVYKPMPMIEIITPEPPVMREDMVKVGMGAADIRYRGEFHNWSAVMTVTYDANGKYSLEQILNFINAGGYICGVGEWRPERDGQNGMFHVDV